MSFTGPITAFISVNTDDSYTVTGNSGVWNYFIQEGLNKHTLENGEHREHLIKDNYEFDSYRIGPKVMVCSTVPITHNQIVPNVKFTVEISLSLTGVAITITPRLAPEQIYDIAIIPEKIYDLWVSISGIPISDPR